MCGLLRVSFDDEKRSWDGVLVNRADGFGKQSLQGMQEELGRS